jgi:preprotein translocase subunit SecE
MVLLMGELLEVQKEKIHTLKANFSFWSKLEIYEVIWPSAGQCLLSTLRNWRK